MLFMLDNRTQIVMQVAVSTGLFLVMLVAWRTQKTYPGFGRWTASLLPNALGWLLISLRNVAPDWASVFAANILVFISPLLLYEGIRQFGDKKPHDRFNYALLGLLTLGFIYFLWVQPSVNARIMIMAACTLVVILRCAWELFIPASDELRPSYWFTGSMFGLYGLVLVVRLLTAGGLPQLSNPFEADGWQSLLFLASAVLPITWIFGLFVMNSARLTQELRKAEADMREQAMTDYLTGAYNRRSFDDLGCREIARARRNSGSLALLILDIDHFKIFNDTYGHLVGDAMLCALAAECRLQLRQVDLLARWGGEEFALLLPETDRKGCLNVAQKLRQAVAQLSVPGGEQAHVTISVGGAMWTPEDQDLDSLLRRADLALYQAKRRGRNCVVMP